VFTRGEPTWPEASQAQRSVKGGAFDQTHPDDFEGLFEEVVEPV
jgi:hypothetical protein